MKRIIVLLHLYAGVLLCVLFLSWFVSGVVMMYQGYPGLTERERMAALSPLLCTVCRIGPEEALQAAGLTAGSTSPRLGMLRDRPVWRVIDSTGRWRAVFADDGTRLAPLSPEAGAEIARAFLGETSAIRHRETLADADQWTLTRSVRNQMPLHRYDIADAEGTRLYVSVHGGEVVSASTQRERWLSWIGAIPHWIYPTLLRRQADAWAWLVIALSGLGTMMSVAGVAIGVWQWRWRRRERRGVRQRRTPYRDLMMRWHHILGLPFGMVTCTWVFSGMMSMNPGRWSPGSSATGAQRIAWMGGPLIPDTKTARAITADTAWRVLSGSGRKSIKELQLTRVAGVSYWVGFSAADSSRMLAFDSSDRGAQRVPVVREEFTRAELLTNAARVLPKARMTDVALLSTYDSYYRDQERLLRLPVLRVKFDDPDRTWLYLDPRTGAIAQRREWKSRLERWLYEGLHEFDFAFLMYRRPLWDMVLITLSIGGALLSVTGVVISWRYARATLSGHRRFRKR